MTRNCLLKRICLVSLLLLSTGVVHSQPTVLDVQLSTYLGGLGSDSAVGVAFDSFDDMWICGGLNGPGFPFAVGVEPIPLPGGDDIFVVHIDVEEDDQGDRTYTLLQTIIIGGSDSDTCGGLGGGGSGIVITPDDRIFIGGRTRSPDFPMLKTALGGDFDMFIAELGPTEVVASQPAPVPQASARLGPYELITTASFGGASEEDFCDLKLHLTESGFALFLGEGSAGNMPLGPGIPPHGNSGFRDLILLRIDEQLNLVRGVGLGGPGEEFFGDLSIANGEGRFTASTGSRQFEGLSNPSPGQAGVTGRFDLDSLRPVVKLHAPSPGLDHLILQKHAWASAKRTADGPQDVLPPVLLAAGTASDGALRPTTVVIDVETNEVLDSQPDTTARVFKTDGGGSVHFGYLGSMPGLGVCTQNADGSAGCTRTQLAPAAGSGLFMNTVGSNSRGQIALVGGIGDGLVRTPNALQSDFGGVRDGFIVDTQQPFLLGLVNATFAGNIGPGELVTAFGEKIGPRKNSLAFSEIVDNALETNVEGVAVSILREDGTALDAPVLNASYGQTTFEMPASLQPGEKISVLIRCGDLVSNPYHLTLREPGISPFLFNGNEAVIQDGLTGAIATMANPLKPGDVGVLWGNSGIARTPACPGPGSLADPTGNPLHRLAGSDTLTLQLEAVTADRQVLFRQVVAFAGSPPGQLCNNVLQVNFALADAAAWSEPDVQAAIAASRALRDSDPDAYGQILSENPWMPLEDPITGEAVPVFVTFPAFAN